MSDFSYSLLNRGPGSNAKGDEQPMTSGRQGYLFGRTYIYPHRWHTSHLRLIRQPPPRWPQCYGEILT